MLKHTFISLTALATAMSVAWTAPANAAEWDVGVHGELIGFIAVIDEDRNSNTLRKIGFGSNSEIEFLAKVVLDNGLQVGAEAEFELENDGPADSVDEYEIWFKGGFGKFEFGQEDTVGEQQHIYAPRIGMGSYTFDPDSRPLNDSTIGAGVILAPTEVNTRVDIADDDLKLNYFTPRLGGAQVGVTYTPEASKNGQGFQSRLKGGGDLEHVLIFSGNYEEQFNDVEVALSAAYGRAGRESGGSSFAGQNDPRKYSFGAALGFNNFTIAGSFSKAQNFSSGGNTPVGINFDETNWDVGGSYETGAWTFAAAYGQATRELAGFDDLVRHKSAELGANYDIGSGVSFGLVGVWLDYYAKTVGGADIDNNNALGVIFETGVEF